MDKKEKVQFIQKTLNNLFPNPAIPLQHKDPFTLLIAVLLSAQCTDKRVNQVTPHLFALADTPEKMSKLSEAEIATAIKSLGFFNKKAHAIKKLSEMLSKMPFPKTLDALKKLPGVGHKTASVVLVQAFKQEAFPVDTHIHRLAKRWGLSNGKSVKKTEEDLKKVFPKKSWGLVHLQMIEYGRSFCKARPHDVTKCPICSELWQ